MKRLYFEDFASCADYMIEKSKNGVNVTAALFYDEALELIREFMVYSDIEVGGIAIAPLCYDGYDKEYYITLSCYGTLDVEPAWNDDRYLDADADLMLVCGDASCFILKDIPIEQCREIYIGIEEDTEEDCGDCCGDCNICVKLNGECLKSYNSREKHKKVINDKKVDDFLDLWEIFNIFF